MTKPSLISLPYEMLEHIFYFTSPQTLIHLKKTCRVFHEIIHHNNFLWGQWIDHHSELNLPQETRLKQAYAIIQDPQKLQELRAYKLSPKVELLLVKIGIYIYYHRSKKDIPIYNQAILEAGLTKNLEKSIHKLFIQRIQNPHLPQPSQALSYILVGRFQEISRHTLEVNPVFWHKAVFTFKNHFGTKYNFDQSFIANEPNLLLKATSAHASNLHTFISDTLREDQHFLLKAFQTNPNILADFPSLLNANTLEHIQKNPHLVIERCTPHTFNLLCSIPKALEIQEIAHRAIQQETPIACHRKDLVLQFIQKEPEILAHCPELRRNYAFMSQAIAINPDALQYADKSPRLFFLFLKAQAIYHKTCGRFFQ